MYDDEQPDEAADEPPAPPEPVREGGPHRPVASGLLCMVCWGAWPCSGAPAASMGRLTR